MVLSDAACRFSDNTDFNENSIPHQSFLPDSPQTVVLLEESRDMHQQPNHVANRWEGAKVWSDVVLREQESENACRQKCLNWASSHNDYCVAIEYQSACYWTWEKQGAVFVAFTRCKVNELGYKIPDSFELPNGYHDPRQTVTSTCKLYGNRAARKYSASYINLDSFSIDRYMDKILTAKGLGITRMPMWLRDNNRNFLAEDNLGKFFISRVSFVENPQECYNRNVYNLQGSLNVSLTNAEESSDFDDLVNGCSSTEIQATMASLQMSKAFCDYNDEDCAVSRLAVGKSSFSECYGIYSSEMPYVQTEEEVSFVNSQEMMLNLNPDAGDNCKTGDFQPLSIGGDCPDSFTCYTSFAEQKCLYWEDKQNKTSFDTCGMLCDALDGCGSYMWGCHSGWSDNCQCFFVSIDAVSSEATDVLDMSTHLHMDQPHTSWFSKQILEPEVNEEDLDAFEGCTPVIFFEFAVSFADTYQKCLNTLKTAPDGSISDEAAECIYKGLSTSDHICANVAEAISNEQAKIEQEMRDSNKAPEDNDACGWSRFLMCRGDLVDTMEHCYQRDVLEGFSDCVLAHSQENHCHYCAKIVVETTVDDNALKGFRDWIKNFVTKVKDINQCSVRGWMQCGSDLATVYETCRGKGLGCMMHRTKNTQCSACVGLKSGASTQRTLSSQPMNLQTGIAQGNYVGGLLPDFSCLTKLADCATKIPQAISQCGMSPTCWATHALADATQCIPCVKDLLPLIELAVEPPLINNGSLSQQQENLEGILPWPLSDLIPIPLFLQDRDFNGRIDLTKSVANNPLPGLHCTNENAAYSQLPFRTDGQWSACMQACDTDELCQVVHMNFAATEEGWQCSLYKSVSDCESSVGGNDQYVFVKPGARDHVLLLGSTVTNEKEDEEPVQCSTSTNSFGSFEISVLVFLVLITFLSGFSVATLLNNKRNSKAAQEQDASCQI